MNLPFKKHLQLFLNRLKSSPVTVRFISPPARKLWSIKRRLLSHPAWLMLPGFKAWSGRPVGLIENLDNCLEKYPQIGRKLNTEEAGSIARVPAKSPNDERPPHMLTNSEIAWPTRSTYELKNVKVAGGYAASIMTPDNQLLAELSPDVFGPAKHEVFGRFRLRKAERLAGKTLSLATPEADGNFGHWLFDLLPRALAFKPGEIQLSEFDHYLINADCSKGFQSDSLRLLGIPAEKVVSMTRSDHFECDRLYIANFREHHWRGSLDPREMKAVRSAILEEPFESKKTFPKRIWLSRKNTPFRRILNETEVEPILERYGFEVFHPERHSLREQAEAFRLAEIVVGPHTSGMCNWMFCDEGTPVTEITSPYHADISFWTIASHAKLDFYALPGIKTAEANGELGTRFLDYRIDLSLLEAHLKDLCG